MREPILSTPDDRYIVVRGRLWRATNPNLDEQQRQALVDELMNARRAVRSAGDGSAVMVSARQRVDAAKRSLGERGPPWWTNGAPDLNRHLIRTRRMQDGQHVWKGSDLMIDPPSQPPRSSERKLELEQAVDFAVQLLADEAELAGWNKVEFLTAVMDSARAKLSTMEQERSLVGEDGPTNIDMDATP
jgi:hypothetical protein